MVVVAASVPHPITGANAYLRRPVPASGPWGDEDMAKLALTQERLPSPSCTHPSRATLASHRCLGSQIPHRSTRRGSENGVGAPHPAIVMSNLAAIGSKGRATATSTSLAVIWPWLPQILSEEDQSEEWKGEEKGGDLI